MTRPRAASPVAEAADVVLVFGAGIWPHGPSLTMRTRVEAAAVLYDERIAPVILCSGSCDTRGSEARMMRALLVERGVPVEAIIADDHGTSTRAALLSTARLGRGRWRRIAAVSSPYHVRRIAQEARRLGLNLTTHAAVRTGPATWRHRIFDVRQHAREAVARAAYAASATFDTVAGTSWPVRVARHVRARLRYLVRDADQVAADSAAIGQIIKSRIADFSDTHAVHTPASGLHWPVHGTVHGTVGDRFGLRHGRLHAGLDVRAAQGTPVRAAAAGHVLFADWMPAYGNVVVLHHGGGLATVYAHLADIVVAEGRPVDDDEPVGCLGGTGRSSGPHLHFEVRVHGSPVDPLVYLPSADARDVHTRHGQHNAVWTNSLFLRGHDPARPARRLTDADLHRLATRLHDHGVRYAYLFAGPFQSDGRVPAYASSDTARRTVDQLRTIAPDLVVLPWLGGLQHLTVHLDDRQWVDRAIDEAARLIETLGVPGLHLDFEFILASSEYVIREKQLPRAGEGADEYGARHVDFHRRLRERLPDAFLSSVIPSTAGPVASWKQKHSCDEAAALATCVDQLSLLHYDTSIADAATFRASLIEQLTHIAAWKAVPASAHVQYLLGVGTFTNARPLRVYRHLDVEDLPHYFPALEYAIASVQRDVRLVDGIAIFCDWTTSARDWRRFRNLWVRGAR